MGNMSVKKKIIVSVTNDLVTDQRVHKVCLTLHNLGFDVLLVGRQYKSSPELQSRPYKTKRIHLFFKKGFLFYAEFNLRLFFFLLFKKTDLFLANDLDTLLPNFLVSKLKNKNIVYDTHEYFCHVPELVERPSVQKIWLKIEESIFPRLKEVFTVNDSIASLYQKDYSVNLIPVRNIPMASSFSLPVLDRKKLGLPEDKRIIILQGSGINVNRGAEEAVLAMKYVENAVLLIIGGGDVWLRLKEMIEEHALQGKVIMMDRMPFEKLVQYTRVADIGLTLDKPQNLNYIYSLPNKIFDYIHAGIPVLASSLKEIKKVFDQYEIGVLTDTHEPEALAEKINFMLDSKADRNRWKENLKKAAEEYCWEKEKLKLEEVYKKYL
jgi:glycosyltransferase involved in cell wall biosynthesis